ncbi:MAG: class I SAM-dependent methyltransferase [Gammaproteobacteria bacterium]|nr:class I SAM-dependent methyltransferase [Gammaproteobacteria bacterium]
MLTRSAGPGIGTPYEWLRAGLPAQCGDVLDLACGSAPMYPLLADASSYLGIDRSQAELKLAAIQGRGPLMNADACALPMADESVDVVICTMAVMLLDPIEAALAEVARVLRPGGVFATIRPVAGPIHVRDFSVGLQLIMGLRHLPEMPQRFASLKFTRLLSDAGLTVTHDKAVRFTHPLASAEDARVAVEALYLPHVTAERRQDASRRLARTARPGAQIPVGIRRTLAVRGTADHASLTPKRSSR